jgi:MYXO-CTERM domain-containing protein
VANVKIVRGRGSQVHGCGSVGSSCDGHGVISFTVTATDDRTDVSKMGYRWMKTRGREPVGGLLFAGQDVRALHENVVYLHWSDGETDDQEDLDFDIEVRAVDLAGNVSPQAATVAVRDDRGGCHIGTSTPRSAKTAGMALLSLSVAALVLRRRRRIG